MRGLPKLMQVVRLLITSSTVIREGTVIATLNSISLCALSSGIPGINLSYSKFCSCS
jgi:hypothetical protein